MNRARLFAPPSNGNETQEIVRKRKFSARTPEDVAAILERLMREKFVGSLRFNLTQGTIQNIEAEERSRLVS